MLAADHRATRARPRGAAKVTPSIPELYSDFECALAAARTIPDTTEANRKRWERAVAKSDRIAKQIVRAPAASVNEMILKIRVVGWSVGIACKPMRDLFRKPVRADDENLRHVRRSLEALDGWKPHGFTKGEEFDALVSLRHDLQRLQQGAL